MRYLKKIGVQKRMFAAHKPREVRLRLRDLMSNEFAEWFTCECRNKWVRAFHGMKKLEKNGGWERHRPKGVL